ncbi:MULTISPECIES: alpha/beta hydrolase family protein [Atopobiaceae]|uniref:Peptidase S9 prolyl oligopeptidase catalytic domain-containing protein n=1 Tax=Parafannyhessea umbonata TaxID=604330 RepID=A0A1H9N1M1_9ACTN|nr:MULTISPECIES: YqiA/YcfP family alpha/beta fold hydrolase [Atopobiaceae]SEH36689.1 hypothetical protein SAMN05216447_10189 [Parafannyhessea umbonata]SER29629.1 hypothetical protein SAMN05216446_0099 [Parafannyhessea umbonata]SJZ38530.1 hypothetical protein SAMN06298223_0104 [Olsenella sp. KH1P3]
MGFEEREYWCRREDKSIYGKLFLPEGWEGGRPRPTAIFSHGLSTNHGDMEAYARTAAGRGMVTYVFDFCGGGNYSRSDWQDNMSLFTEQHDLESVAWELSREPFVDANNVFLCGSSLGAAVTFMAARANADLIRGCVLLYPAFNLYDSVHAACPRRELIPESYRVMKMNVSGDFLRSCYDYDFFEHAPAFPGDVLIFHGDSDEVVPLSYSERAASLLPQCELRVIPGGGHGFTGDRYWQVVDQAAEWLWSRFAR